MTTIHSSHVLGLLCTLWITNTVAPYAPSTSTHFPSNTHSTTYEPRAPSSTSTSKYIPRANVSVLSVDASAVLLQWRAGAGVGEGGEGGAGRGVGPARTELIIRPLLGPSKQHQRGYGDYHRLVSDDYDDDEKEEGGQAREHTLHVQNLSPDTDYVIELYLLPRDGGVRIPVNRAVFKTASLADGSSISELVLVAGAILLWVGAMCMFYKTYAKNCLNESREYRFEHEPMNIKDVQIIQENDHSVIQKKYNDEHIKTVEARRVHLERLNSMPNMKLALPPSGSSSDTQGKTHGDKLGTVAEIEETADCVCIRAGSKSKMKAKRVRSAYELQETKPRLKETALNCEEAKSLL